MNKIFFFVFLQVKLKCVQTLRTIFQHPDRNIATPYIHALAPRLVEFLYTEGSKQISSETELSLTLEIFQTVEVLVGLAEPKHSKSLLVENYFKRERNNDTCKWRKGNCNKSISYDLFSLWLSVVLDQNLLFAVKLCFNLME